MDTLTAEATQPNVTEISLPDLFCNHVLSEHDNLVKAIRKAVLPYHFHLSRAIGAIQISGDEVAVNLAAKILQRVCDTQPDCGNAEPTLVKATISSVVSNALRRELAFRLKGLPYPLQPKSLSQVAFMNMLLEHDHTLMFGLGPTGTGKTHMAIAAALNQLAKEEVKSIVITRPHVVMKGEVVTPKTRAELEFDDQFVYFEDILRDLVGNEEMKTLISHRKLELIPLGHMRGRTFNEAFLLIDEAQNMTVRKMRMAVTRVGWNSRMVITGDPGQADLMGDEPSGLNHLLDLLQGTDLARIHKFEQQEIVRNAFVARIEELYAGNGAFQ